MDNVQPVVCPHCRSAEFIIREVVQIEAGRRVSVGTSWPTIDGGYQPVYLCAMCHQVLRPWVDADGHTWTSKPAEESTDDSTTQATSGSEAADGAGGRQPTDDGSGLAPARGGVGASVRPGGGRSKPAESDGAGSPAPAPDHRERGESDDNGGGRLSDYIRDWGEIQVGDILYETAYGTSLQLEVITKPERLESLKAWRFGAVTARGVIPYFKTDSSPYGPHLSRNPHAPVIALPTIAQAGSCGRCVGGVGADGRECLYCNGTTVKGSGVIRE